jgi:hypothetical protein
LAVLFFVIFVVFVVFVSKKVALTRMNVRF